MADNLIPNQQNEIKKPKVTEEVDVIKTAKNFWDKNNKMIIYVGISVIVLLGGWIGYDKLIKEPKELKAAESVFLAENLFDEMAKSGFNKDSVNIVLNGGAFDGTTVVGLLKVINNYGGTKTANRSSYMAGVCYLQIKEFDKAIKYLKEFDGGDAYQIKSKAFLLLGHAYAEKNQVTEALDHYKKAAEVNEKDESITPDALMVYAEYAELNNKKDEAIGAYKKIKDNFPSYIGANNGDIDKRLARLGEFSN
jgi:tetratricopeptide (TPR) repeat protein